MDAPPSTSPEQAAHVKALSKMASGLAGYCADHDIGESRLTVPAESGTWAILVKFIPESP